jgi:phosphonopyruvate decarboxylase
MINLEKFCDRLRNSGVEFLTGVPDTLLNDFCLHVEATWPKDRHVIAANEGNAVALAVGYHLATNTVPLVYMQNSGMGNALNPLLSLTNKEVYAIPLILLIGWRGDPSSSDWPQHQKQGELTPVLLDALDIPYRIVENAEEKVLEAAEWAAHTARTISAPTALIAQKRVFERGEKSGFDPEDGAHLMSREDAISCILKNLPRDTIFVATTGRATRELHELRNLNGSGHEHDFLNVGAMGHASSIATGIALANKNRLVVCLDGDGAAIMHLGSFTTVGKHNVPNLLHVVLNNGVHESVGGQSTAGLRMNMTAVAEGSGYKSPGLPITTENSLKNALSSLISRPGPSFIEVHIRKGMRSDLPPLKFDLVSHKLNLIETLTNRK